MVGEGVSQIRRGRRGRTRANLTAVALALAGLLTLVGVGASIAGTDEPSPFAGAPIIESGRNDAVDITWVGDILLGDAAQPLIDTYGFGWPGALLPELDPDHVVIANLEGPLTMLTEPFQPTQRWSYNSDPAAGEVLAGMGITAINLANNHSMDRGPQGLKDTELNAGLYGLTAFGAGATSFEASRPLIIRSDAMVVAVLGFLDDDGLKTATTDSPGGRKLSLINLQSGVENALSAGADHVIAAVQWGDNYAPFNDQQRAWAQAFADAGYTMVIGAGPHISQPIAIIDGMPVIYSLGNYVFGTPGRFSEDAPGFGLVVTSSFRPGDVLELSVYCIQTDNQLINFQPRRCTTEQSNQVLPGLNPDLSITGDIATMTIPLRSG